MKDLKLLFPEILYRFVVFFLIMTMIDYFIFEEIRILKNIIIYAVLIPFIELPRLRDTRRTLKQIGIDLHDRSQLDPMQSITVQTSQTPEDFIENIKAYDLIQLRVIQQSDDSITLENKRPWYHAPNDIIVISWSLTDQNYQYHITSRPKYSAFRINPDHGRAHYNLKIMEDILLDQRSVYTYVFSD